MLSRIDEIIYPNRCEVVEFSNPQRFVYPIFKNGSSSLKEYPIDPTPKKLLNNQIKKCNSIDVILRNPHDRFISGVNTFVFNLLKDNPKLDKFTIMYFVETYLFLNRHYAPQMSWLGNLNKYTSEDCKLNLFGLDRLSEYTTDKYLPPIDEVLTEDEINRLKTNTHNQVYIQIDLYLLDLLGESLTFKQILDYIKSKDSVAYSKCIALD